jgi:hypothetical protein
VHVDQELEVVVRCEQQLRTARQHIGGALIRAEQLVLLVALAVQRSDRQPRCRVLTQVETECTVGVDLVVVRDCRIELTGQPCSDARLLDDCAHQAARRVLAEEIPLWTACDLDALDVEELHALHGR